MVAWERERERERERNREPLRLKPSWATSPETLDFFVLLSWETDGGPGLNPEADPTRASDQNGDLSTQLEVENFCFIYYSDTHIYFLPASPPTQFTRHFCCPFFTLRHICTSYFWNTQTNRPVKSQYVTVGTNIQNIHL